MDLVNALLSSVIGFLDKFLPVLGFSPQFMSSLDNALSTIIGIIQGAGYFLPLDIMVLCFSAMLIVDNFALLTRVGQFVIKLIRG